MNDIIYLDASNGVSGDMFAGALIDLGADLDKIKKDVESLGVGIGLKYEKGETYGISAGRFSVINLSTGRNADAEDGRIHLKDSCGHHTHRHLSDIKRIIQNSTLSAEAKSAAVSVFELIAAAEAEVHGTGIENVHFHEVGALDSIGDIAASVSAFCQLGPVHVCSSPVNTGSGTVKCRHGILPVPAPASLKLLNGMTAFSDGTKMELATPTGIALLKHFTEEFTDMPKITVSASGCGMGTRDIGRPNVFRAVLGKRF